MTTATAEVLRAAKALIDTAEKWCKGYEGAGLCLVNAIHVVTPDGGFGAALDAIHATGATEGYRYVFRWNDAPDTTHADVMAALDSAIAACEAS